MAQIIDIKSFQAARSRAEAGGLSKLTQWTVRGDGSRERKEWVELRAAAKKPFQFRGVL